MFPLQDVSYKYKIIPKTVVIDVKKEFAKHKRIIFSLNQLKYVYFDSNTFFSHLFGDPDLVYFDPKGERCDQLAKKDTTVPVFTQKYTDQEMTLPPYTVDKKIYNNMELLDPDYEVDIGSQRRMDAS